MKAIYFKIVFLISSFVVLGVLYDFSVFLEYVASLNLYFAFFSLSLIVLNQFLSTIRFRIMLSIFDVNSSFFIIHKVNLYSILSGIVFFNFFGQSISRSYLISGIGGREASFFVTAFERAISLSTLLIGVVVVSVFVVGDVSVYIPSSSFLIACFFLIGSFLFIYKIILVPRQRTEIKLLLGQGVAKQLWLVALIVILMHISMLGAYTFLVIGMYPAASIQMEMLLANLLTMLGGALPISFGGWGAREMSAGFAFNVVSLPSELGISVGILIGLLTLTSLFANIILVLIFENTDFVNEREPNSKGAEKYSKRLMRILSWVAVPIIAVLMMVQLPVPLKDGRLTINFADPVAVVLGLSFAFVIIQRRMWSEIWISRHVSYWLITAGIVLLFSYFNGVLEFGYSEWALYNRLVGSGVLLSYLLIGAAATAFWGEFAIRTSIKSISIAVIVIAAIEFVFRIVLDQNSLTEIGWFTSRWTGLLYNPNSYSFYLMTVFCLIFSFSGSNLERSFDARIYFASLSTVIMLVYLSDSKAAMISFVVLSVFFLSKDWRKLIYPFLVAAGLCLLVIGANEVIIGFRETGFGLTRFHQGRLDEFLEVQPDRIVSLVEGWQTFIDSPLLGGGLGAFHHSQLLKGSPLVIHNSFLWVLAEMGVVGFILIVLIPMIWLAKRLFSGAWRDDRYLFALLLICFNAVIMGMAHELVFQRVFWLALGMLLASPFCLRRVSSTRNL